MRRIWAFYSTEYNYFEEYPRPFQKTSRIAKSSKIRDMGLKALSVSKKRRLLLYFFLPQFHQHFHCSLRLDHAP